MTALENVRRWSAVLGDGAQIQINGVKFCKRDLDEVIAELERLKKLEAAVKEIASAWQERANEDMLAVIWPDSGAKALRDVLEAVNSGETGPQ